MIHGLILIGTAVVVATWVFVYAISEHAEKQRVRLLSWWDNTTLAKNIKRIGQKGARK